MIQPELFARLRLLAEAYRLPVTGPAERVNEVAPPSAVQQVLAEVESRLPDGRFRVLAAGQRFDVLLPPSTEPGDRVRVSIAAARGAAAQAPSAEPAPAQAEEAVTSELSATGRFVAQLAARAPEGGSPERVPPGTLPAAQPLLPDAPVDARVAAATLRELVNLSGLFYESHQAQWVEGARTRDELQREPQGRLPPLPPAAGERTEAAPLDARTAPIVQQQLNALEARHLVWQGQIWPGQPMRWEIEERGDDEDGAPAAAEPPARAWSTRLDLALPRLGGVSAVLTLAAEGLRVRLSAEAPATGELFAGELEALRGALGAAGLVVSQLGTAPHERA